MMPCVTLTSYRKAVYDRHTALARRVVHFQSAICCPLAAVLEVYIAGAVHDLQRPKEPNAGTFCRCDRYIFHAGNGQADITGTACVSHPVRSCRAQHKILSSAKKGDPFQFLRMLSTSHCNGYGISVICNAVTGQQRLNVTACDAIQASAVFLEPDRSSIICRQCRCAHAQHHAQRHEGREQPLGQGRLLHIFLLFAYGGMCPP